MIGLTGNHDDMGNTCCADLRPFVPCNSQNSRIVEGFCSAKICTIA